MLYRVICILTLVVIALFAVTFTVGAGANANLFVSAENSIFSNFFAGPMVIEVVIIDFDIRDTDEAKGEPDVTVNDKDLRMVQAVDGNWYGYFADRLQAQTADATQAAGSGKGLDFGEFCDNNSNLGAGSSTVTFVDAAGVAIASEAGTGGVQGTTTIEGSTLCDAATIGTTNTLHVVRESKLPVPFPSATETGQIGIDPDAWPFVQLYNFVPTGNVIVQYNKGVGVQSTTLTFDIVNQFAGLTLDNSHYHRGNDVRVTIQDISLNIDPTDEDSWTWGTNPSSPSVFYQLFDENGLTDADGTSGAVDILSSLTSLMFQDNGVVLLDTTPGTQTEVVVTLDDNADQQITGTTAASAATVGGSLPAGSQPMTFVEIGPNSGIFTNTDELNDANLDITLDATVGKLAIIDYNQIPTTILVINTQLKWLDQFGFLTSDRANGVDVDSTGVYVVGTPSGTFPDQPFSGGFDAFVRKYDTNGVEIWTRQFGSSINALDFGRAISVDSSGVYATGVTNGIFSGEANAGGNDGYIRKYDTNGNHQWTRQFGTTGSEFTRGISVDSSGVYVTGQTNGAFPGFTFAGGAVDVFVIKYDTNGNHQWTQQFGTSALDIGSGVSVDSSGVYVAGITDGALPGFTNAGGQDAFVRKYDTNGIEIWTRQFAVSNIDQALGVDVDSTGVYVAGRTCGTFSGETDAGGCDAFVRKYDTNGNEVWTRQFGTEGTDIAEDITVDSSGVYVTGQTFGSFTGFTNAGERDSFVVKYDINGNQVWVHQFGTSALDIGSGVSVDSSGVYVAGQTEGAFTGFTNAGAQDAFVAKITVSAPPVANDDAASAIEAVPTVIDVLANDSDPDGDILSITSVTNPPNGNAAVVADGSLFQTFTSPTPASNDQFGFSVSVDGNNVLVGAHNDDTGAGDAGSAYLFDATTGNLLQTFNNPTPATSDQFGISVSVDGNNVLIGARLDDTGAGDAGSAYLFDATTGNLLQTFNNPTPATSDQFGRSVSVDGNNVLVGAHLDDTGATDAGSVYLFDATTGNLLQTFNNPTPATGDTFGFSVSVDGNNVLVGAFGDDTGATNAGSAYLFDATTGNLLQTFNNPTPATGDTFGISVSVDGNNVLIGARLDDTGAFNAGSAYLFDATTGNLLQTFNNPTPATDDRFGNSVSVDGNNVLVGAELDDTGATNAGSAYLFDATPKIEYTSNPSFSAIDTFDYTISDGFLTDTATVTVDVNGAPVATNDAASAIEAVPTVIDVLANDSDPDGDPLTITSVTNPPNGNAAVVADGSLLQTFNNPTPATDDFFGISVSVDGNNVLVGALFDDAGGGRAGSAYLFDATTGNLLQTFNNPTPAGFDFFGESVSVDGNNVLIGARNDDTDATNAGSAYLFDATTGNLLQTFNNPTPATADLFGTSVSVDGNNVFLGAPNDDTGATDAGSVYMFDATTGNLLQTFNNPTPATADRFGQSVSVDGNNVLVGARLDDTGVTNVGSAYLFDATTGNLLQTFNNPAPATNDGFGTSVSVDGNKVLLGAHLDDTGATNAGSAYLFDATTGNLLQTFNNPTPATDDFFGFLVSVDGNNVLVGAHFDDTGATNAGSAYLFDAITGNLLQTFNNPTPATDDGFGSSVSVDGNNVLVGAFRDNTGTISVGSAYLFDATPKIEYTSNPSFSGIDTFDYTISDGSLTDTVTVTVKALALGALASSLGGAGVGGNAPSLGDTKVTGESTGTGGFGGIIAELDLSDPNAVTKLHPEDRLILRQDLYENQGINNIQHVTLYFGLAGSLPEQLQTSKTYIMFEKGKPLRISDPNGYFTDKTKFNILERDAYNFVLKYDIEFASTMPKSDMLLYMYDGDRNISKKFFDDKLVVLPKEPEIILEQEVGDSKIHVPDWIKTSAGWWSDGLISEDDFVKGIEYLIQNDIMKLPPAEFLEENRATKVPDWVRNTAGWWADGLIPDDGFVNGIKYLVEKGIIKV